MFLIDYYGAVNVADGQCCLFMPRLPEDYAVWMGHIETAAEAKERYRVDEVRFCDEMPKVLKGMSGESLLTLNGVNTDSGKTTFTAFFDGISEFDVDDASLHPVMADLRVIKTEMELDAMRYVNRVSSDAHRKVMRYVRPGMREYHAEAAFVEYCHSVGGCRHVGYNCICGAGTSGATLHYGHAGAPNDQVIRTLKM